MTEPQTLVRWPRKGRNTPTRWHLLLPSLNDEMGRTGCGRYYPRRHAEHKPSTLPNGDVCRNCQRAVKAVPVVPA